MRKKFSELLHREMGKDKNVVLVTADLGYGLWDKIKIDYPGRFFNVGSSEQLMIGMASGMAMEGKKVYCYSITPFLLYRPFEFIRNYVDHEKLNIILVGGGRDKDYGYLGFSHWSEEDSRVMTSFPNIYSWWPHTEKELEDSYANLEKGPVYINLRR